MASTDGQGALILSAPRRPAVESEVMAILVLVVSEVMFFAGLVSAYNIVGARSAPGLWPPPTDPVLPVSATAGPTAALIVSGGLVAWAGARFRTEPRAALAPLLAAGVLALGFVGFQVGEFVELVNQGLTMVSSAHGGFFYTIVGAHVLHALVALGLLAWAIERVGSSRMSPALFRAFRIFWYFVVGLWPFLYAVVYR